MNLINIEHISKIYGEKVIFDDASFGVQQGDKIGIVGINGTGKSTLLKVVAGEEIPDEGQVVRQNGLKIAFVPQNPTFPEGMDIRSYALQDADAESWQVESNLTELGITQWDRKIDTLSGGQKRRVVLAKILAGDFDVLLLDEPTNHLDQEMISWLEDYLRSYRGTVLMVTHDRYFLDRIATRIVEVDKGKLYSYPGNYAKFVELKEERQNMALATERKRKSLLRTELEWLHRGARARSTKQKAHIDRIQAMQEMKDIQEEKQVLLTSTASRMGNKTIELSDISKSYGNHLLIRDYNYIFLKNDRIGIIGPNGCGKTTLLKIINGIVKPDTGTIEIGQTIRIGYFSQENEYMDDSMKVIDYVKEAGEYIQTSDGRITASQMLERFLFEGAIQWSKIEKLSGGEKRRLYLLRILMSAPNVLILDEPTNDLDIQTLTILENYLDGFDGIIIVVSHDRYFLDRTVRRIFAFEGEGAIRQYEGGYSDYLIRKELEGLPDMTVKSMGVGSAVQTEKSGSENSAEDSRATWKKHDKKLKFSYKEQREFETIDEEITALEEKIEVLDAQMLENASNSVKLNELLEKKEEVSQQLDEKMDRWVYLNDLNEQIQEAANSSKE